MLTFGSFLIIVGVNLCKAHHVKEVSTTETASVLFIQLSRQRGDDFSAITGESVFLGTMSIDLWGRFVMQSPPVISQASWYFYDRIHPRLHEYP